MTSYDWSDKILPCRCGEMPHYGKGKNLGFWEIGHCGIHYTGGQHAYQIFNAWNKAQKEAGKRELWPGANERALRQVLDHAKKLSF